MIALEHDALGAYTPDGFVQALAALIAAESPAHVIFSHTYQTRDFAPKLAARLDRALVTDCTAVQASTAATRVHAADVPGQGARRRRPRRARRRIS